MANLREIKARITAVENTKKITKTMEMISAAKAKRAVDKVQAAQPYARKINELIKSISTLQIDADHPLLRQPQQIKKVALFFITANRGLCGAYNNNVIKLAMKRIAEYKEKGIDVDTYIVGKKGATVFKYRKLDFVKNYTDITDKPTIQDATKFANFFMEEFESGRVDKVELIYTEYVSSSRQTASDQSVLPLSIEDKEYTGPANQAATFEPSPEKILTSLLPRAVRVIFYQALLDSNAGEQISRRISMKNATDAASDMIRDMSRLYNRARQAKITQEISEIVAGADSIG